ncbi:hypothetical protein [Nannocystis bainbridge]|uniref:Uncharacterized protein n=1 Tax=Nannocystis bainbridge TaxID=2995303 RepID=A0ABT5DPM3_9BACT|nr:hypothetical protein [Nannocystis bainbridge]MDC0715600.1 hypothetical protein [Nannocystis bainbridge]
MAVVARCNGTEIDRRDGELWIVERPAPPRTAVFVLALVAVISLINAAVQAVFAIRGGSDHAIAAAILTALGGASAWLVVRVVRFGRRRAAAEPRPLLIVDVAGGRLLDPARRVLAPLAAVRVERVFQAASSARALALRWPQGSCIIARGSPFGDSVDDCAAALRGQGLGGDAAA